jgi:hypothetical protein
MTAERELEMLKSALRLWANSKTYQEGCRRWAEVVRLMGEDVAADQLTPKQSESRGS